MLLGKVVTLPQGLKIGVMAAFRKLNRIGQIEGTNLTNVVQMPATSAIIFPCHPVFKMCF